jgi:hypothetical protein
MGNISYNVKVKVILRQNSVNELEFLEFEKVFEESEPINARIAAFKYYQKNINYFLETKNRKYYSDIQARKELVSFSEIDEEIYNQISNNITDVLQNGIGIFCKLDVEEIFIHGIGDKWFSEQWPDHLMYYLETEADYYLKNNLNTKDLLIDILYCSADEWNEGYLGDGQWVDESYVEPQIRKILHTPFDWSAYEKPYWWEIDKNKQESILPTKLFELIEKGESNQVEFKPALLYNFSTSKGGIGVKGIIAKAICAFLNSNGGFLIIGVTDKGEAQGLSYDFSLAEGKNEKDFFMLEFDQMLEHFLSFSIKSNVSGQFYQLNEKDIFVVAVTPSKRRPIFLKGQNGKEFYVRGEASSRQLTDIEELINYCIEKWGQQ